jgi:predicted O-methyltransferase YrrM
VWMPLRACVSRLFFVLTRRRLHEDARLEIEAHLDQLTERYLRQNGHRGHMRRVAQAARVGKTALRDGVAPLRLARRAIRDFGAVQRTWELQSLLGVVQRHRPRVVVEIGTYLGGTLSCWAAVSRPDAVIISVDMTGKVEGLAEPDGRAGNIARIRQRLTPGQRLVEIIGNSHLPETLDQLRTALAGASIDVLWVDGDHSYEGVSRDTEMYAPLVRAGGLIAFHDIHHSVLFPSFGSPAHWREIKAARRTDEFIGDRSEGSGMGIGVVFA